MVPDWIYHFQTLWAAGIAALVGIVTIFVAFKNFGAMQNQLDLTRKHRRDELSRKLRMAKAGMPLALTDLSGYCDRCLSLLEILYHVQRDEIELDKSQIPDTNFPSEPLNRILPVIEYAEDIDAASIGALISWNQIQHSRLVSALDALTPESESNLVISKHNIFQRVLDTLLLKYIIDGMYDYARGREEKVLPLPHAEDAMKHMFFAWDVEDENLQSYIREKWPSSIFDVLRIELPALCSRDTKK